MERLTFRKEERLCSQRQIDELYAEGQRFLVFPFSVQWKVVDNADQLCQVMIVAPTRKLRHAVDRNRMKRLMRESYRHNKSSLYDSLNETGRHLNVAIVYVNKDLMTFKQVNERMKKVLLRLQDEVKKPVGS